MEVYVGTDVIEVERIKKAIEDENFLLRVFTDNEIEYCETKNERVKYQHYAARFAAKEAVFKAISPIINNKYDIGWKNIEILKKQDGRPYVNLLNMNLSKVKIDISISHVKDVATATAVATVS